MIPLAVAAKRRGEPWIHYQHAVDGLATSRFPEAEQEARAALTRLPQNSQVLEVLSLALYKEGNDAEAGKYLRELGGREPRNSFATNTLAMIELKEGDAAGARDLLMKALPFQPLNAYGQVYLGRALQALDQDDEAIKQYRVAIQINPELYEAQMALGSIYEKHGELQQAILFYRRSAQLQPGRLEPLRNLTRAYLAAGMKAQADETIAEIQKREQAAGARAPTSVNR
jgi:Flp pilus assembly protein TadD